MKGKNVWLLLLTVLLAVSLLGCDRENTESSPSFEDTDEIILTETAEEAMNKAKAAANKLAEDAGLAALSYDVTMLPIAARGTGTTAVKWTDGTAVFTYTDGKNTVTYTIDTKLEKVQKGLIVVLTGRNGGTQTTAVTDAGVSYLTKEGKRMAPKKFSESAEVEMTSAFDPETGHLILDYKDTIDGQTLTKRYEYFMVGGSLAVQVTSADENGNGGYSGFYCGGSEGLTDPSQIGVIYVEEVPATAVKQEGEDPYFVTAYLDKAKTFATRVATTPGVGKTTTTHGMSSSYEINSLQKTNPLHELFYITASDKILDCVSLNNAGKSAYRDSLDKYVVYDQWVAGTTYTNRMYGTQDFAEDYDIHDILYVEHRWQRDTLDISTPAHYPASSHWGTISEFMNYIDSLKENGWRLALHEDYWFMQPSDTNQYWNVPNVEKLLAQDAEGVLRYGWQTTSYANLANMMVEYAKIESPQIHEAYGTDAAFLDVNGGVDPSVLNQITLNGESKYSRTLAQVVADNVTLFTTMKEIYGGPIITEGAQGLARSAFSLYAGYVDSISREITDCSSGMVIPDYELKYIRRTMANQGMGPAARFQVDASQGYNFDRYNAFTLAYGHTGFMGDTHTSSPVYQNEMVNAYYTFRAVQEEYLDTDNDVREIFYYTADGKRLTLEQAVLAGYDFTETRLYVRYMNGLEICVNCSSENWEAFVNGKKYLLDSYGYCAANAETGLEMYSCLVDGVRVDFCKCKDYTYANPRGNLVNFGDGIVVNRLMIKTANLELNTEVSELPPPILFSQLYGGEEGQNGDNGLTYYYTDGTELIPFTERSKTKDKGFSHGEDGVLVYPTVVPKDNYGCGGTSEKEYIVLGYKLPLTGLADLYSWTVLQGPKGEHGYEVRIALGSVDNVVQSYWLRGDTQYAEAHTYSLKVTAGEELYIIYEPTVKKDKEWFGFINTLTYTYGGSGEGGDKEKEIKAGDTIEFAKIAGNSNGDNGLTFYWTEDGRTLNAYTDYDPNEGRWYDNTNSQLNFVDPREIVNDNYGLGQSSSSRYMAMGYELPATGDISAFIWTALQGPSGEHGYHVKLALDTPDNIVAQYDNIGDTQSVIAETYNLSVKKGQILYVLYEPAAFKDGEWFGYITKLTYNSVEGQQDEPQKQKELRSGDEIKLTELVGKENGENGLSFYWTADGRTLNAYTDYDPAEGRWYDNKDGQLNFVDPRENAADNYGLAQSSSLRYPVLAYELPADGNISAYAWTALQGPSGEHGYHIKLALGTVDNIVAQYDNIGDTQSVIAETFSFDVKKGDILYYIYEPVQMKDGEWFGYINSILYNYVGDPAAYHQDETWEPVVKEGSQFLLTELATNQNGLRGLTYYYTTDGRTLKPITNHDVREDRWFQGGGGLLIYPRMDLSSNYSVAGTSADMTLVIGTKMPAAGTVDYYARLVLQGSADVHSYTVKIAKGTVDNVIDQFTVTGYPQTVDEKTTEIRVEKDEEIFMIFEPGNRVNGEWFGFNASYTYKSVK